MGSQRRSRKKERHTLLQEDRCGVRSIRVQGLLVEAVDALLRNETGDARLEDVRIVDAQLSPSGALLRLWFTAAAEQEAQRALAHASGWLRFRLAQDLGLKRTPELRFKWTAQQPQHLEAP